MILFGGTFDPVHRGHLQVARFAGEMLEEPIHLLLAPKPQLRTPCSTSYSDRWEMLQLACESDTALIPFDFEQSTPGPTHTIVTLERLSESTRENFVWVLGTDALMKTDLWYRAAELPDWLSFLVFRRPGFADVKIPENFTLVDDVSELLKRPGMIYFSTRPMLDLNATTIRHLRKHGKDIRTFVTTSVYDYIISKHIYELKDSC